MKSKTSGEKMKGEARLTTMALKDKPNVAGEY